MSPAVWNHLWQSTLFAAAAAVLTLMLRGRPARVRHGIWLAASLKFLVPFSLLIGVGAQVAPVAAPVHVSPRVAIAMDEFAAPMRQSDAPARRPVPLGPLPLAAIWICGVVAIGARWMAKWRRVGTLVRKASPVDLGLPLEVRSSPALLEPGVFGMSRPVLLLPEGIAERLEPAQFRAIVAHELCHFRRRDNLTAAVHMLVSAIFWFHPLVWYIGARLIEERERACDEEVLHLGSPPEEYAQGILNACRLYLHAPLACVPGVTGADLRKRIEHIMARRLPAGLGAGGKLLLACAAAAAILAPLTIGLVHAQDGLAFEVASVKINRSGAKMGRFGPVTGGRLSVENMPLPVLVATAYDVDIGQITGWPSWAMTERFDIEAKAENRATEKQIYAMLRTLLAERFHFVVHRETKEQPIHVLVVDKGGPKFKAHTAPAETLPKQVMPIRPGDKGQVIFNGVDMPRLAWFLGTRLRGRVVDRTGLSDRYDFELAWAGERDSVSSPDGPPPSDPNGPDLETAVREQLGLKLQTERGPVEFLTIEHVERPGAN